MKLKPYFWLILALSVVSAIPSMASVDSPIKGDTCYYIEVGKMYEENGDRDKAIESYEKALSCSDSLHVKKAYVSLTELNSTRNVLWTDLVGLWDTLLKLVIFPICVIILFLLAYWIFLSLRKRPIIEMEPLKILPGEEKDSYPLNELVQNHFYSLNAMRRSKGVTLNIEDVGVKPTVTTGAAFQMPAAFLLFLPEQYWRVIAPILKRLSRPDFRVVGHINVLSPTKREVQLTLFKRGRIIRIWHQKSDVNSINIGLTDLAYLVMITIVSDLEE